MRKLNIKNSETAFLAIQEEIRRSDEAKYDHRLHGLLLVANGQSCRQAAGLLGENPRTVQRWVRNYERDGFDGLRDGAKSGRPPMLDAAQRMALEADLRDRPDSFGLVGHLWDGPLLREHLRRKYDVRLGVRQCQRLFHGMGFRLRKPRPQVAGAADPERSDAFKKTASPGRA